MTPTQSQADVPPPSPANVLLTPPPANPQQIHIPYLTPLFSLLLTTLTPIHILDMAQKTIVFFGILYAMGAARYTNTSMGCSYKFAYLGGGVVNGLVMDFLERKLRIRRGSGVHFALQVVVSVVISSGMSKSVKGVW
jgi:hypothetical protein